MKKLRERTKSATANTVTANMLSLRDEAVPPVSQSEPFEEWWGAKVRFI